MKEIVPFMLYTGPLQSNKVVCFNLATAIPSHYFSSACGDCSNVICCVICSWANSHSAQANFRYFARRKKCLKAAYSRTTARASSRLKKLYFWCSVLLRCKALRPASSKPVSKSRVSSKKSATVHLTFTILCWKKKTRLFTIGHFRVPESLTFNMRL